MSAKDKWKAKAKELWPRMKPTRPGGFTRKDGVVMISGYDENVVVVIEGRDIDKLKMILP